jgi:Domain of Unknown Function (DUF1206)
MDDSGAQRTATGISENPVMERLARAGFVVSGLLHLVIAWIAAQLAIGGHGGTADQTGAMRTLARTPIGKPLLAVAAVALAALAVWMVAEAMSTMPSGPADRLKLVGCALVYAVLAWTSVRVLLGGARSSGQQSRSFTADVLKHTGGKVLIVAIGLGVLVVGGYHVVKGVKKNFLDDLSRNPGRWAVVAGQIGYCAKGIALAVVGILFVSAGVRSKPSEAGGLDAALRTLLGQPFGPVLLLAVALGLACYAVYSFARAKYARL